MEDRQEDLPSLSRSQNEGFADSNVEAAASHLMYLSDEENHSNNSTRKGEDDAGVVSRNCSGHKTLREGSSVAVVDNGRRKVTLAMIEEIFGEGRGEKEEEEEKKEDGALPCRPARGWKRRRKYRRIAEIYTVTKPIIIDQIHVNNSGNSNNAVEKKKKIVKRAASRKRVTGSCMTDQL